MKLNLTTKFMKGIVTKMIATTIRKKFGYNIDIQINEILVSTENGKIHLHADVVAETTNEEFVKILKSAGLN